MNQVKTGCANCYYNLNGFCSYGNVCGGSTCQKQTSDGNFMTVPLDAPIVEPKFATPCLICGKEVVVNAFESVPKICDECKKAIEWAKGQVATARQVEYDPTRLKEITEVKIPMEPVPVDMITEGKAEALELIKEKLSLDEITSFILSKDLMEGKLTLLNLIEFVLSAIKRESEPSGVKAGIEAEEGSSLEYRQKKDPNGFRITVKEFVQRFAPHGSVIQLVNQGIYLEAPGKYKITNKLLWEGYDYLITDPEDGYPPERVCKYKDHLVTGLVTKSNGPEDRDLISFTGKITLSIVEDNEKTSKELKEKDMSSWLTRTDSTMNGTKDTIIATNNKEEVWESKPGEIKPNTSIATTEGKIENAC